MAKQKGSLKKCPLHRFGADYVKFNGNWFQCKKCGAYHLMDELIGAVSDNVKIKKENKSVSYEFY